MISYWTLTNIAHVHMSCMNITSIAGASSWNHLIKFTDYFFRFFSIMRNTWCGYDLTNSMEFKKYIKRNFEENILFQYCFVIWMIMNHIFPYSFPPSSGIVACFSYDTNIVTWASWVLLRSRVLWVLIVCIVFTRDQGRGSINVSLPRVKPFVNIMQCSEHS